MIESPCRGSLPVLLIGVVCFLIAARNFAEPRGFFEDETAQVDGIALGPTRVVSWLASGQPHKYSPGLHDRMPPLSYWVGQAWAKLLGASEMSLRGLGLFLVSIAILAMGRAAGIWTGRWQGVLAAVLLFGLAPIVVAESPDIRPYPLFLCLSAVATWIWVVAIRAVERAEGWIPALLLVLVAAQYTHFFGVVLSASLLGSGLLWSLGTGRRWRPWLTAGLVACVVSIGLAPFVLGSISVSGPPVPSDGAGRDPRQVARLAIQLVASPVLSSRPWLLGPAVLGVAGLILGLAGFLRESIRRRRVPEVAAVLFALAIGAALVMAAGFASTRLEAFRPTYNLWMLPLAVLAAVAPLTAESRLVRRIGGSGLALLIGSHLLAAVEFTRHRAWLDHGADRVLTRMIEAHGPTDLAILYDGDVWFAFGSLPVDLRFRRRIPQFVAGEAGMLRPLGGSEAATLAFDGTGTRTVVVAGLRQASWKEALRRTAVPEPKSIALAYSEDRSWTRVDTAEHVALGDAGGIWFLGIRIDVYQRSESGPGP